MNIFQPTKAKIAISFAILIAIAVFLSGCTTRLQKVPVPQINEDIYGDLEGRYQVCQFSRCIRGNTLKIGGGCALVDGNAACGSYTIIDWKPNEETGKITSREPIEQPSTGTGS